MNKISTLRKIYPRRMLFVTLIFLLILLLSLGFTVPALTQAFENDNVFTGCVNQNSGTLRNVAVGSEPARECNEEELQITWDHAEPAFESRIAALEERVAELEEPFGTLELFVDCDAGDTVGAALDDAQTHAGPVNIAISGVCEENVEIDRDDVYISGMERDDGIRAANPAASTVTLVGARGVKFSNMTISAGTSGIVSYADSAFTAENVTVRDMTIDAVRVGPGSSAFLSDCSILNNLIWGVNAMSGGTVQLVNCKISGSDQGLFAAQSGTIMGIDLHVTGNRTGVGGHMGGEISIWNSIIEDNDVGVAGQLNSSIKAGSNTRIVNNESGGVVMSTGSVFVASDNSIIEGNGGHGIVAEGASTVSLGFPNASIIRNNTGDGIKLLDLSNGEVGDDSQIVNNNGWGINCAGPSAITSAQLPVGTTADLSGNGSGPTNCP